MPTGSIFVDVGLNKTASVNGTSRSVTYFNNGTQQAGSALYVSRKRIKSLTVKNAVDLKGWRPPSPYISVAVRRESIPYSFVNRDVVAYGPPSYRLKTARLVGVSQPTAGSSFGYGPSDSLFFDAFGSPYVSSNTITRAEVEALNKLQSISFDIGGALAESRETLDGVARAAYSLGRVVMYARRGNWGAIARTLGVNNIKGVRTAAEGWLAYQYGIKPLMLDIQSGIQAFNTGLRTKGMLIHASRSIENDVTPLFIPTGSWKSAQQYGHVKELAKVSIWAEISSSSLATLSSLGVLNPLAAVWEGLSFSFLVDWLLPIGNFLQSMNGTVGLTFRGGTLTTRIYADLSYSIVPLDPPDGVWLGAPIRTKYKCLAMKRTVYGTWPIPWLYIKNPFSTGHVANAAALIVALSH